VTDALIRAAKRGVSCRVLADDVGSMHIFKHGGFAKRLNDAGVITLAALRVNFLRRGLHRMDVRNHRKLVVVDGRIGYTGSQNVVDATYGHKRAGVWHDMSGRFTGPVVAQLQEVFVQDWAVESDTVLDTPDIFPPLEPTGEMYAQVVPSGPTDTAQAIVPQAVLAAINASRDHLILSTPYFVPDEPTLSALVMAAGRGVRVELVVPARSDHRTVLWAGRFYYQMLLESGIAIYEHNQGLLHAKTLTVDDAFALLGSTNLDMRSFHLNYEMNVLLYGEQITQHLRFAQQRYISESRQIGAAAWRLQPAWRRYGQSAAALLSPLL
jgi:cardiolipin synthase